MQHTLFCVFHVMAHQLCQRRYALPVVQHQGCVWTVDCFHFLHFHFKKENTPLYLLMKTMTGICMDKTELH